MTDTNTSIEAVLRRIQKLLAIAQDDRANPNEAAAAAHQAEKLMAKFQLEHADVIAADLKKESSFTTQTVQAKMKQGKETDLTPKRNPLWAQWLAVAVAKLNDCIARQTHIPGDGVGAGAALTISGYKADVQVACWSFDYLVGIVVRNLRAYQKEATRSKAESESYRRGFVMSILVQINAAHQMKQAQEASAGRELMIVKSRAVEAHFGEASYKEGKTTVKVTDAYQKGREDGKKVDATRRAVSTDAGEQLKKLITK